MPENLDHLRDWIGREERRADWLTPDLAAKFHATLALPGAPPAEGEPAPPMIHLCLAQPALPPDALGGDGHPQLGTFLPPVPLPRRMWAGGDLRFHAPLLVGERVTRVSRIAGVTPKIGRTGPLCFIDVEHEIRVGDDSRVAETQTLVYRGDDAPAPPAAEPAPEGETVRDVETTPTLLFRYSALTFNGHRIHYDRRYAREVEHYPGLVVHGPMQATLLCLLAAEIAGQTPRRFRFRSLSTIFDGDGLRLHARRTEAGVSLWTSRPGGPLAMSAEAEFA
ncbi:FAS1-like dehydratase domain-containing protein [Aureimonas phyllosphaerae]|uniref:3-methylfumaryl-CoA hydratase n=1 Tax=Aureimonas phyllosphaerae TaxID=1166078 RepID=A0A7W6BWP9_9HYPH|nr:MaoC family dehydratase N-terminal domain-containing protein [Aureimonas phyllosphaerae]MBB3936538.1 3-methylfumaryl-CoA hydratase [Aureimonas phyllosphaerae]MBB3960598.1 3-methylfumaryl-CoA hydratase [Aureimonas phyllosphaerae]SFF28903.1 3-methylfumaryl-CoA hydratase [Aureimonas phyllosphaerae]